MSVVYKIPRLDGSLIAEEIVWDTSFQIACTSVCI